MNQDLLIFFSMAAFLWIGFHGAVKNQVWCFRVGSILSAFIACVGLAYFGWRPFFGGSNHSVGTYFGCLMLCFGVLSLLMMRGVSIGLQRRSEDESLSHGWSASQEAKEKNISR